MLLNNLTDVLGILDSHVETLKEVRSDMDLIASIISTTLSEGHAQSIAILMQGEEDDLEDILIDFEEELDQLRKEDIRDLTKQLKVMRKLIGSLVDSIENLDE
jgi:hypothetical protein